MFQTLSDRLNTTLKFLRGQGRITENNIKDVLKDVRTALLEADVALDAVQHFLTRVKKRALGTEVSKSLTPGQAMIKLVKRELIQLMGEEVEELNLRTQPPAIILMAGLQGSGKTTSTAKLARFLKDQKKNVWVVSVDVYRPAAIQQLQSLANDIGVTCFASDASQKPAAIAAAALDAAKKQGADVLIVDTAGRLHIDQEMMQEIKELHQQLNPIETLFVVDSMTGQDAANTAKVFHDALPLTGVVLTKVDGDARGGAALSIRHITGKPIKFLGVGEKTDALEPFHPDRVASRILGMGDMLSLIEQVEKQVDRVKADKMMEKLKKGKGFDFQDFMEQLEQMESMGGAMSLMSKMPGLGQVPEAAKKQVSDKNFTQMKAIIQSMTKAERFKPDLIDSSRKRRIAAGSGTEVQDINKLLKQFLMMQKMMKKMGKAGGLMKLARGLGGAMPGMMPKMPVSKM